MNRIPDYAVERTSELPPLEPGDRLDQKTFHERYEAMPPGVRAELIGGGVHMPSPLKTWHGRMHPHVIDWLMEYERGTPGVETYCNVTAILGPESEPQPDVCLIVSPGRGGQMHVNEEGYLEGAPELVVEIATSADSIDLHGKRRDYEQAGVKEYVVVVLRQQRVLWLVSRQGAYVELGPGPDGILRSEVFPGLWLDANALLRLENARVLEVIRQGLATPEHAAFVARLAGQSRHCAVSLSSLLPEIAR
jgi:Uma2 family endonuclease